MKTFFTRSLIVLVGLGLLSLSCVKPVPATDSTDPKTEFLIYTDGNNVKTIIASQATQTFVATPGTLYSVVIRVTDASGIASVRAKLDGIGDKSSQSDKTTTGDRSNAKSLLFTQFDFDRAIRSGDVIHIQSWAEDFQGRKDEAKVPQLRITGGKIVPKMALSASTTNLVKGKSVRLTWNSAFVKNLRFMAPANMPTITRTPGSIDRSPAQTTTYTLTGESTLDGTPLTSSTIVTVAAPARCFSENPSDQVFRVFRQVNGRKVYTNMVLDYTGDKNFNYERNIVSVTSNSDNTHVAVLTKRLNMKANGPTVLSKYHYLNVYRLDQCNVCTEFPLPKGQDKVRQLDHIGQVQFVTKDKLLVHYITARGPNSVNARQTHGFVFYNTTSCRSNSIDLIEHDQHIASPGNTTFFVNSNKTRFVVIVATNIPGKSLIQYQAYSYNTSNGARRGITLLGNFNSIGSASVNGRDQLTFKGTWAGNTQSYTKAVF